MISSRGQKLFVLKGQRHFVYWLNRKSNGPGGFPQPNQRYTMASLAQADGVAVTRLAAITDFKAVLSR
jgi:hypothetical protein